MDAFNLIKPYIYVWCKNGYETYIPCELVIACES